MPVGFANFLVTSVNVGIAGEGFVCRKQILLGQSSSSRGCHRTGNGGCQRVRSLPGLHDERERVAALLILIVVISTVPLYEIQISQSAH
jgi:hypothetical protein